MKKRLNSKKKVRWLTTPPIYRFPVSESDFLGFPFLPFRSDFFARFPKNGGALVPGGYSRGKTCGAADRQSERSVVATRTELASGML